MFASIVFWTFQLLNGYSSLALLIAPRRFHESMFKDPEHVYKSLGFSETACEMLHNVLRGQGVALLSITIFLFRLGSTDPNSFLLIAITCLLTLVAHILTYRHHLNNELVKATLGDSLKSILVLVGINLFIGGAALAIFLVGAQLV